MTRYNVTSPKNSIWPTISYLPLVAPADCWQRKNPFQKVGVSPRKKPTSYPGWLPRGPKHEGIAFGSPETYHPNTKHLRRYDWKIFSGIGKKIHGKKERNSLPEKYLQMCLETKPGGSCVHRSLPFLTGF